MTERVKIKCDDCKFVDDCVDYGWKGCKKFTPAPSTPMTNEEWLKSMNTEQFADALAWIEDRGESPTVRKENVKAFEEWLKQPYKGAAE